MVERSSGLSSGLDDGARFSHGAWRLLSGTEKVLDNSDGSLLGGNLVARYQHHGAIVDTQAQAYIDQTEQFGPAGGTAFVVHTYDFELQQTIAAGLRNRIVWGGGERVYGYGITNTATFLFEPPQRGLNLGNLFVQDTIALTHRLNAVFGVKLEDDPFSDGRRCRMRAFHGRSPITPRCGGGVARDSISHPV